MIKLYVIEDHEMVTEGIRSLLEHETDIQWAGNTAYPSQLLVVLKHNQPDVILMDINLPEKSGIELCREVKERYPDIHIIALSISNQQSIIEKMLQNGADGYLLKNASKSEIVAAIHQVVKGKSYVSFSVSEILKKKATGPAMPMLTKREKEVLGLIAEGLTSIEIGEKLSLTVGTVESHRKNMLAKFDVKNTAALLSLAMKHGLM